MVDEVELKKARFYALKLINFRPRTIEELTDRLKEKGFSALTLTQVVEEFTKKGLLDDAKFSKLWVDSRMASKPKGAMLLKKELQSKGVDEQVIDEVISKATKGSNEYDIVKQLADARMRYLSGLDKITAKRRLFGFLKRRGFSTETVMKVLKEVIK